MGIPDILVKLEPSPTKPPAALQIPTMFTRPAGVMRSLSDASLDAVHNIIFLFVPESALP